MVSDYTNSVPNPYLEWIYPQRCIIGDHFEIWRFPYVNNGILEDEGDFVLTLFNGTRNYLHLFTGHPERTKDLDYLARILWLVHDISEAFGMDFHVIDDWENWDPGDHIAEFEALAKEFCQNKSDYVNGKKLSTRECIYES